MTPEKQIFYCFGCHTGGNVYTFLQKIENIDFPESVKLLASILGMEIEETQKDPQRTREDEALRINTYVMRLYQRIISSQAGKTGYEYFLNRGLKPETIERFSLGYAPDEWSHISSRLLSKKADMKLCEELGILSVSQKNPSLRYDRFRNRVIFPIFDRRSRPIAFGGRSIDNSTPKYLNSPESIVFRKRDVLYGLNVAQEHIRELNRAIIVEGYLDVIGCHQEGICNVVAPLGTALTEAHIRSLSRFCSEVIYLFDSDSAGMNAALKSLTVAASVSIDVRVARLPEGDPFDYILEKGVREFMIVVDNALKPADFRLEMTALAGRGKDPLTVIMGMFEVLKDMRLESERAIYLKKISSMTGINEDSLRKDFSRYQKDNSGQLENRNRGKKVFETDNFEKRGYRDIVILLSNYPELIKNAVIDFDFSTIDDEISSKILQAFAEIYKSGANFEIYKVFDYLGAGLELDFLNYALNTGFKTDDPLKAYSEIYLNMKLYEIDQKINEYAGLVSSSGAGGDQFLTEIEVLRREKEKLSSYLYDRGKTAKRIV